MHAFRGAVVAAVTVEEKCQVSKVLVIGAGGVGSVAVHKMAMNPDIFSDIHLASRTVSKLSLIHI